MALPVGSRPPLRWVINSMNTKLKSLGVNRCRKRIKKYLDAQRKKQGNDFSISHIKSIPLVSAVERIWLVFVSLLLIAPLALFRDIWWLYLILIPPSLIFLWKGLMGTNLDISELNDLSDNQNENDIVSDENLIQKAGDIIATREASYFAVNMLLMIALAIMELAVIILSAIIMAVLSGG